MGRNDIQRANSDMRAKPVRIGVLAYPGAQRASIHGLIDLFETASRLAASAPSRRPGIVAQELSAADCRGRRGAGLSAVILPPRLSGTITPEEAAPLLPWLRARHREGTSLCSVCAGAFLLAGTGLLDGRRATTHWALAGAFAAAYPKVQLEVDRMLIDDGDLLTAGGVMAWIDLGLRLVERFLTPALMLQTARMFLVDPAGREQSHYAPHTPSTAHGDEAILRAQQWLADRFPDEVSMPRLAAATGLGERTFLRRFKAATGDTPIHYLQRLRVGRARELLELSARPVDDVAWRVGYEDPGAFRKVFQRVVGITPGEYRRRFAPRAPVARRGAAEQGRRRSWS
jgi:transcriptional regulator GlxA family with amidase domain